MSTLKPASWSYAEEFVPEPEVVEAARRRGMEFGDGQPGRAPGRVPCCAFVAAAVQARHVVEIGTGAGTSGLWLLAGMPEDGVLTTIDSSAEHQRAAREAYAAAGYAHQRTRVITGAAADVLPRMTDGAYDLVVVDADKDGYPTYVEHAVRLLRSGGVSSSTTCCGTTRWPTPPRATPRRRTLRDLGKTLRDHDELVPALLPVSDGLLVAVKR